MAAKPLQVRATDNRSHVARPSKIGDRSSMGSFSKGVIMVRDDRGGLGGLFTLVTTAFRTPPREMVQEQQFGILKVNFDVNKAECQAKQKRRYFGL